MTRYWRVPMSFRPPSAKVSRRFWFGDSEHFVTVGDKYKRPALNAVNLPIARIFAAIDDSVTHEMFAPDFFWEDEP